MNESAPPPAALPVIDSRSGWHAAVTWAFTTAMAQGARRIVVVDADFADWPLDDTALLQGLTDWLRQPQRRLVLLAASFDALPRRCPRFTAWRAPWSHAIEGWQAPEELARDLPTVLSCDKSVSVQLIDPLHWRGRVALDDRRALQWCEEIDVVLQRSERALGVRHLGL